MLLKLGTLGSNLLNKSPLEADVHLRFELKWPTPPLGPCELCAASKAAKHRFPNLCPLCPDSVWTCPDTVDRAPNLLKWGEDQIWIKCAKVAPTPYAL